MLGIVSDGDKNNTRGAVPCGWGKNKTIVQLEDLELDRAAGYRLQEERRHLRNLTQSHWLPLATPHSGNYGTYCISISWVANIF